MRQCTNNIMMVRPASFQYNEETAVSNDYQQKPSKTKEEVLTKAQEEFDQMVELLEENGVNILVIEDTPSPEKPDAIFPNNWISMHANGEIFLFPMATPNRSAERRPEIIEELKEYFDIYGVNDWSHYEKEGLALEGTGSIIFNRESKRAYACLSPRTNEKLFKKYCETIGYEPFSFYAHKRNGAEQYHTNVVMCIGQGFVIVCLESITDKGERNEIIQSFDEDGLEIIEISREQLEEHYAGNMLNVNNNDGESILVMSERAKKCLTESQINQIEQYATIVAPAIYQIEDVGGGSARCMMAEIFLPESEE